MTFLTFCLHLNNNFAAEEHGGGEVENYKCEKNLSIGTQRKG